MRRMQTIMFDLQAEWYINCLTQTWFRHMVISSVIHSKRIKVATA